MALRVSALLISIAVFTVTPADAQEWSRARISKLPDSAFAVVEIGPNGKKVRHLPHHDETGAVDSAHLKTALARLPQVKWLDPANKTVARRHLEEHRRDPSAKSSASVGRMIQMR